MNVKKVLLLFSFGCFFIAHSQEFNLVHQFNGRYQFTMFGNTMNLVENELNAPCQILTNSSATLNLGSNDQIEKAYLYWSGSSEQGDYQVTLNQQTIIPDRTFIDGFFFLPTFSAFADVTQLVQSTGNGNYTLADFDISDGLENFCPYGVNYGGWAIIIVYKNNNFPNTQINVYDGLQSVRQIENPLTIQINNLNVVDNTNSKIGFLAWEGDSTLAVSETLSINGNLVGNPPLNPINNAFNGTNSFTNQSNLYNMDLDVYNVDPFVNIGDTSATIELTSGQDYIMVNAIVTKLNSELPDAIIINPLAELINCNQRIIQLNFELENNYDLGALPSHTPISIYINNILQTTIYSTLELTYLASETFEEELIIPQDYPQELTIKIVADDLGNGTGNVIEFDELNNENEVFYELENCFPIMPEGFSPNNDGVNDLFIPINVYDEYPNFKLTIYNRYGSLIYTGFNKDEPWNGKYNNKNVPTGTYFYVLKLNDERYNRIVGWVYLNR